MRIATCVGGPMAGQEFAVDHYGGFQVYVLNQDRPLAWIHADGETMMDTHVETKWYRYHEVVLGAWSLYDIFESMLIVPMWVYEDVDRNVALTLVETGLAIVKALMPHYV